MSWYTMADLPPRLVEDVQAQGWDKSGWSCGCWDGHEDDGTPLIWFCKYHEGYYDGIQEQRTEQEFAGAVVDTRIAERKRIRRAVENLWGRSSEWDDAIEAALDAIDGQQEER